MTCRSSIVACVAGLALSSAALAQIGPDVIVGDLPSTQYWGTGVIAGEIGEPGMQVAAYSVGTTSCNSGTDVLLWIRDTNEHPVIGQNMFRLHEGRFLQIGQSWLKHGFVTVNNGICGTCDGRLGAVLGLNCSDPYGAGLNGSQNGLGPRHQVNPTNGEFQYPPTGQSFNGAIARRLQVPTEYIATDGATYWVDGQYVTPDDAKWGNALNNVSYQEISFNGNGLNNPSHIGDTVRELPAIYGWQDEIPSVVISNADYTIPNSPTDDAQPERLDARFVVGSHAIDLGNGMWRYEYAVYNQNADRAGSSFSVPTKESMTVQGTGFHDVHYHSGEPYDDADWRAFVRSDEVVWLMSQSFAANPDGNALRWGTTYSFWFEANRPPVEGTGTMDLFAPSDDPGQPDSVNFTILVPEDTGVACACEFSGDDEVTVSDLLVYLDLFLDDDPAAEFSGDGEISIADLLLFLDCFFTARAGDC